MTCETKLKLEEINNYKPT